MVDKRILNNFIDRYHLNGAIEKIKWVSDGNSLKARFINDSQNLVGDIFLDDFKFPKGEFGIYSTSTLSKLLNILDIEILFDIGKETSIPSRFIIADTNVDIKFNLADPQVIPNTPSIQGLDGDYVEIGFNDEFITKFIKSRDAVNDEVFFVSTREGFTSKEVYFNIGVNTSNVISFAIETDSISDISKMPFNSVLFKEILKQNRKFDEGILKIYPKGLMAFVFKFGNLETNYYLVRNQN